WSCGYHVLWLIGIITAGMTSFYMFPLWFLTFFGEYRGPNPETAGHRRDADARHAHAGGGHGHGAPHESPWVMVVPLMILALLSLVGGWIGVPHVLHGSDHFGSFLSPVFNATAATAEGAAEQGESTTELAFTAISVAVGLPGWLAGGCITSAPSCPRRWPRLPAGSIPSCSTNTRWTNSTARYSYNR